MKKFLSLSIFLLLAQLCLLAQEVNTSSKITEVTVYRSQAKESRSASVTIPAGNSDVVLTGISMGMIDQSLQVAVKGGATLLSATVRVNYFNDASLSPNESKKEKLLDSIHAIDVSMRWLNEQRDIHNGELILVNDLLQPANPKDGYKPEDLNAMADIYRKRITELRKWIFNLSLEEEEYSLRRSKFQNQLNEMAPKQKPPVKEIVLSFSCEDGATLQLKNSYIVTGAGWNPMYDVHVSDVNKPLDLTYKAKIYQGTGVDWKDVNMTVSTGNPSLNNNRPIMNPVFIDYIQYAFQPSSTNSLGSTNTMYAIRQNDDADFKNLDGELTVSVNDRDVLVDFEIAEKQTIPSDNKEHVVRMKSYDIPASYKYHAVPKLDNGAFLLARITDYGKYNLLSGTANVFMGDTYVGQVALNPSITADTMLLSLGRDERIIIKRTRVEEKCTKKFLSGKRTDTYAYEITVRNNKSTEIEIEILDQVPLSRRPEEIEVKMLEGSKGEYNEKYGSLLWTYKINPNSSKNIKLTYSVTYPDGKTVGEQ